ncbi:MAG: hypothetical protein PVG41_03920 [Desulfobacteraceae bacterium]|jgi:hypothetical protein
MLQTQINRKENESRRLFGDGAADGLDPALYPFTNHYMLLNGHQYHYVDEGNGHPIVMVHGNPTWSFYYRKLIKLWTKKLCMDKNH